ncbi:MAG: VacB/RNase II family 3'-5' exoribonuclease, partial [Lentisphaeria bacterium]|nr:VacB/RNase II family 3'-5' exoribonuclease [Lentisphaeria bacterium]
MPPDKDTRERLLEAVRRRGEQGIRRSDLRRLLNMTSRDEARRFRDLFRDLLAEGVLVRRRGGRYVPAVTRDLVAGVFRASFRGFGFVVPAGGGDSIFIPPKSCGGAISGDRVLVAVSSEADERGPVGEVRRITERTHTVLVASLVDLPSGPAIRPLRRELPEVIELAGRGHAVALRDLAPGDWVEVRLNPQDGPRAPLTAVILRHLAAANPISADLDAIVAEFNLPEAYGAEDESAAAALQPRACPRTDLRHLTVVTIDPVDAKDFDDGLSLEPGPRPGVACVGVHIADVAAFVVPDSPLDAEARKRAFTAYLPGRTLPMLPRALAADACSLIRGEDRPAHSVFLDLDETTGEVLAARRQRSLVRVRDRLTFEEVGNVLTGEPHPSNSAIGPETRDLLLRLAALATAMRQRRAREEAFLDLAIPEIRVLCSEDPPRIHALQRSDPGMPHQLVEEFMLAANVAVASELAGREIPGLFRNHAPPRPTDLAAFGLWLRQTLGAKAPKLPDRAAVNAFIETLRGAPLHDAVLSQFLRALPRAGYGNLPSGHYGLGKELYCHFTSPIRRYPDLLVHQQLLEADARGKLRTASECGDIAAECSAIEEQVDAAYYAASDRLKLRYLQERL